MPLRWIPRFRYDAAGNDVVLTLSQPMMPPVPGYQAVGGIERSAAGVPAGYRVRSDNLLEVTLRFMESEWPNVLHWITTVQMGVSFLFYPKLETDAVFYTCYLDKPELGERVNASRGDFPGLYTLTITLRSANATQFDLRYFAP